MSQHPDYTIFDIFVANSYRCLQGHLVLKIYRIIRSLNVLFQYPERLQTAPTGSPENVVKNGKLNIPSCLLLLLRPYRRFAYEARWLLMNRAITLKEIIPIVYN
jgi:hypothetical protein